MEAMHRILKVIMGRLVAVMSCLAFFLNQSPLANEVNHAETTC